jgi:hypothetical protein
MAASVREVGVSEHSHPHEDEHEHRHAEAHRPKVHENVGWHPGLASILDVGGDVGALILYTEAAYEGREIEVSRDGEERRVHTAIHARKIGDATVFAGVYPELAAGSYHVWVEDPALPAEVTIVGGEVAELDWRA